MQRLSHRVDMLADSQTPPTWTFRADLLQRRYDAYAIGQDFHTDKGLEAPSMLSDTSFNENVLLLQGIVVDHVVQTTIVCHSYIINDDERYHHWLGSIKDMTIQHPHIAMQENVDLAIASILVVGRARSGIAAQPDDLKVFMEYIESLAIRDGIVSDGVSIRSHVNKEKMRAALGSVDTYWCKDRRFFVTAAGYMGLGPRCMEPEDIVVVLRGGGCPFILRKKLDGYQLIGQAYVHDIMHGEAVELDKRRGGSEMVFHVR